MLIRSGYIRDKIAYKLTGSWEEYEYRCERGEIKDNCVYKVGEDIVEKNQIIGYCDGKKIVYYVCPKPYPKAESMLDKMDGEAKTANSLATGDKLKDRVETLIWKLKLITGIEVDKLDEIEAIINEYLY